MNTILQPMGVNATTQSHYSSPTPSPPHSPYNFYAGLPNTSYVWYPPVMDPVPSFSHSQHTAPMTKDADAYPAIEELPSSSASPNSQFLGIEGLGSSSSAPSPAATVLETNRVTIPSVPAACLACRGKHLKCDGQSPCSRCTSSQSECIYVASRRGYKGPRRGTAKNSNKRHASSPARESSSSVDGQVRVSATTVAPLTSTLPSTFNPNIVLPDNSPSPFVPSNSPPTRAHMGIYQHYHPHSGDASGMILSSHQVPARVPVPTPGQRCIDSFYRHFHPAHPFVLPRDYVLRIAKEGTLEPLLAAMRWIGSLYIDAGPTRQSFFDEAYRLAYEPARPKDGFLVQAMLLLVLGLDGSCQQEKAREVLVDVERLAVQIGLNTRLFASLNSRGMPILEESWRRTWWDLYVVDSMIAGVHRTTNFLLYDIPADVALPCEEHEYVSGHIPQPLHLEDMEDNGFSGEEREFSSFAYRIQCARNLGKFMRVPPIYGPEDESLGIIEALLTNWRLHLPESKRYSLYRDGKLDEMMFQAHMMHHATSILLHQPHSQLDSSPTRSVNSCAPHAPVPSGDAFNAHTKHTIQSANEISKLVTHRVPLLSHSHFFACVLTLSSIVHISRWALLFVPHNDDNLRQQIRLNIGALGELSRVWPAAARAAGEVKGVAQEVYRVKKQQQSTPQYWLGLSQEDVINSIATDESIIAEIENIPTMPGGSDMLG